MTVSHKRVFPQQELTNLIKVLKKLRKENKILLAYLFGSLSTGKFHNRSDIDLAIYLNAPDEELKIMEEIIMAVDRKIDILRLDDEDESPFIVQEALKGIPVVKPDINTLYKVSDRVLHETESIRFKRGINYETKT